MAETQSMAPEEDIIQVNEDYGFKANIRQKIMDIVRRIEFLEKIGIRYSITIRSAISFVFVLAVCIVVGFFGITSDLSRGKFIGVPLIGLLLSILAIVGQMCLIMPSYGSLFKSGLTLGIQIFKRIMVNLGRWRVPNETMIHDIREDGIIEFYNGDFGRLLSIDGMTNATAYPSEIRRQEVVASQYHNGRKTSTTEVHITSSQKQNAERQIETLETRIRGTRNPAKYATLNMDYGYMRDNINGVKPTIVQHILFRNQSERVLNESLERFDEFAHNRGMYYDVTALSESETEKILGDIYALK